MILITHCELEEKRIRIGGRFMLSSDHDKNQNNHSFVIIIACKSVEIRNLNFIIFVCAL